MVSIWPEVTTAGDETRHELVLTGGDLSRRIDEKGFDDRVYDLIALNFLEVSKTSLSTLSEKIGNLVNMTNLVLHGNKLTSVPVEIGKLTKLKLLDMSRNSLSEVPPDMMGLVELQTLNLSGNSLSELPDVSGLTELHILDISHNELTELPEGITSSLLTLLAQVYAQGNQLTEVPTDFSELPSLRALDISDNKLTAIPAELSECCKLKEMKYGGNKLKDRRLAKMMDQCTTKAVLTHLTAILEKERKQGGGKKGKDDKKGKKKKGGKADAAAAEADEVAHNLMQVLRFDEDAGVTVRAMDATQDVRPYIVCCVVKKLNFKKTLNMFKRFITLQTKLHDTSCSKRQVATIATHDLQAIKPLLVYDAWSPQDIKITPLFKRTEVTAARLVASLRHEAEELRKEKKRNTVSGVYKYLELLRGKPKFPCLVNGDGTVISFPPITNCDATKVTKDTTAILVEVTSNVNLDTCKRIMEEILRSMLEMGLGEIPGDSPSDGDAPVTQPEAGADLGETEEGVGLVYKQGQVLTLEQARVVDHQGSLKVVYPSRVDLQSPAFHVERS